MKFFLRNKFLVISLAIVLILAMTIFYYLFKPRHFPNKSITYILTPGTSSGHLAKDLKKLHVIEHPILFRIVVRMQGVSKNLKGGEYRFDTGISLQQIINKLKLGKVVQHEVTIVDGWTLKQALQVLDSNPYLKHELTGLTYQQISEKLGLKYSNPEGLFLPETYQFSWPDSDYDILKRAARALSVLLQAEWQTRTTGLVYKNPYQALIAASLIQKESGNDAERSKISGVIYRRLVKRMRLQIDPTVIYALGDKYKGKLTRKDLKVKSPYNTYLHYGLPPTPIALSGANAIHAAVHPDDGDELYFVAKGDGTHHFSSSLKGHDRAIIKYLLNKPKQNNLKQVVPSIEPSHG